MTRQHLPACWGGFIAMLSRATICLGGTDHSRATLERMPGIDVENSLRALRELGGCCDCEIVYGVAGIGLCHSTP